MSNPLSVHRVKFQPILHDGTPDGMPTFGVLASDAFVKPTMTLLYHWSIWNKLLRNLRQYLA